MSELEMEFKKTEKLRLLSEELVRKQKAVEKMLTELLASCDEVFSVYDGFLQKIKAKRDERKKRLEKFMAEVESLKEDSELDELEKKLLKMLIDKLSRM